MTDAQTIFDDLCRPFPSEMIDWRVGSTNKDKTKGMALAYIDARTVMDRLDTVCGPGNWQCNYTPGVNGSIICNLGIKTDEGWVWKADGAGATDFEGEKGALSDAFKRSAVRWGLGRYLYEMPAPWVAIENNRIPEAELKKLTEAHDSHCKKTGWGDRAGIQAYRLLRKIAEEFVTDAASAQDFKTKNSGELALLPVAMRRNLLTFLDRVGGSQQEAAE
jgi:hypothetical protein